MRLSKLLLFRPFLFLQMFGGFLAKCRNFVVVPVSCVRKFGKYAVIFNRYFYLVLATAHDLAGLSVVGEESPCFDKRTEVNLRYPPTLFFALFYADLMWREYS